MRPRGFAQIVAMVAAACMAVCSGRSSAPVDAAVRDVVLRLMAEPDWGAAAKGHASMPLLVQVGVDGASLATEP
jgi:hypothetical protein